jgi:hypothetical protein
MLFESRNFRWSLLFGLLLQILLGRPWNDPENTAAAGSVGVDVIGTAQVTAFSITSTHRINYHHYHHRRHHEIASMVTTTSHRKQAYTGICFSTTSDDEEPDEPAQSSMVLPPPDTNPMAVDRNNELDAILLSTNHPLTHRTTTTSVITSSSSPLRQAIQYIQDHAASIRLSKSNWDNIFNTIEDATAQLAATEDATTTTTTVAVEFPMASTIRQDMTDMYQLLASLPLSSSFPTELETSVMNATSSTTLQQEPVVVDMEPTLRLFGAATTTEPPAVVLVGSHSIQQPISPQLFQDILSMPMSSLTPSSSNTFLYAGIALAILEGMVSFYTGINLNVLVGFTFLVIMIDRIVLNGATLETIFKVVSPELQQRIYHHEAGHFLLAYLLGCPIESIVVSAYAALQDPRFRNRPAFSAGTSFFDPVLSEQMNAAVAKKSSPVQNGSSSNTVVGSTTNKTTGGVTRSSIDRYSMIVMAGIAAEADFYGQADGGASDEYALITFLSQLRSNAPSSRISHTNTESVTWDSDQIRNQARWGALQSMLLLRQYRPAYDAVVKALEYGGTLKDCIYAIEHAGRKYNLPTRQERQPVGYIAPMNDHVSTWTPNSHNNNFINSLLQKK